MNPLRERHCKPLKKGDPALDAGQRDQLMQEIHGDWNLSGDGKHITRTFEFKNFYETIEFVNALAWIANREDHHPDLEVSYKRCTVHFSTHSVGGLSENDFVCAAKTDDLLK